MEQLIEALKNNKNNLLYFYNKNCGHCKQLQPKISLLENKNIGKFFQYDTHKNVGISNAFEIDFVPTLIVIENKKYKKLEGFKEIEKFF